MVRAADGSLASPMVTADADGRPFVWVPNGVGNDTTGSGAGRVSFTFFAASATTVTFGFEVIAPTGNDDSFFIQVDGGSPGLWHTPRSTTWTWRTYGTSFNVAAGAHTLNVIQREDGTKLASVRIESGDAIFQKGT